MSDFCTSTSELFEKAGNKTMKDAVNNTLKSNASKKPSLEAEDVTLKTPDDCVRFLSDALNEGRLSGLVALDQIERALTRGEVEFNNIDADTDVA
jgi:hypothetical protein